MSTQKHLITQYPEIQVKAILFSPFRLAITNYSDIIVIAVGSQPRVMLNAVLLGAVSWLERIEAWTYPRLHSPRSPHTLHHHLRRLRLRFLHLRHHRHLHLS